MGEKLTRFDRELDNGGEEASEGERAVVGATIAIESSADWDTSPFNEKDVRGGVGGRGSEKVWSTIFVCSKDSDKNKRGSNASDPRLKQKTLKTQ